MTTPKKQVTRDTAEATISGTRLQHAAFHTSDALQARDFYGRILGLTEILRPELISKGVWYSVGPSQEIHITISDASEVPNRGRPLNPKLRGLEGRHLAFSVDNLDNTKRKLDAEGIPYVGSNDRLPQIFLEDPDGNLIEINSNWADQTLVS